MTNDAPTPKESSRTYEAPTGPTHHQTPTPNHPQPHTQAGQTHWQRHPKHAGLQYPALALLPTPLTPAPVSSLKGSHLLSPPPPFSPIQILVPSTAGYGLPPDMPQQAKLMSRPSKPLSSTLSVHKPASRELETLLWVWPAGSGWFKWSPQTPCSPLLS